MKFKVNLGLFFAFSLVIPITYLSIRFKLFKVTEGGTQLSIWAFIVIAIFVGVVAFMIKYYLDGMKTKYSYLKQFLEGLVKVILPLGLALLAMYLVEKNIDVIAENIGICVEALLVIFGCETIAVLINPLPKWAFDNNVNGLVEIVDKMKGVGK